MPYNYLIDEKIRENFNIDYANSVIIIDEAHNISNSCEEVASKTITEAVLESSLNEIQNLLFETEKLNKMGIQTGEVEGEG